jgi:hypothetical protein
MAEDPRTDRHPDDGVPGKYPTPPGEPKEAPGGAGTGTEDAPEKAPDAQPGGDKR